MLELCCVVMNKNVVTAMKSWPATALSRERRGRHARPANPNKSFAVLTLRTSRYRLSQTGGDIDRRRLCSAAYVLAARCYA